MQKHWGAWHPYLMDGLGPHRAGRTEDIPPTRRMASVGASDRLGIRNDGLRTPNRPQSQVAYANARSSVAASPGTPTTRKTHPAPQINLETEDAPDSTNLRYEPPIHARREVTSINPSAIGYSLQVNTAAFLLEGRSNQGALQRLQWYVV